MFTHGCDIFSPPQTVVYHLWSRSHRPPEIEKDSAAINDATQRKSKALQRILSLFEFRDTLADSPTDPFGHGQMRSLTAYEESLQVSFLNNFVAPNASSGAANLKSSDFADDLTLALNDDDSLSSTNGYLQVLKLATKFMK